MEQLIITRHLALVQYLRESGLVRPDAKHVSYAKISDVVGKHIFGILPLHVACHAEKMTELQLRLPVNKRGVELTVEEVKTFCLEPKTYSIREVD